jgi:hypothetical protein
MVRHHERIDRADGRDVWFAAQGVRVAKPEADLFSVRGGRKDGVLGIVGVQLLGLRRLVHPGQSSSTEELAQLPGEEVVTHSRGHQLPVRQRWLRHFLGCAWWLFFRYGTCGLVGVHLLASYVHPANSDPNLGGPFTMPTL